MSSAYLSLAEYQAKIGGAAALAAIASVRGLLDADATAAVNGALGDVAADLDAKLQGLGLTIPLATVPEKLKSLAAPLVTAKIYESVWNPLGVPTPKEVLRAEEKAEKDIDRLQAGDFTVDGSTPAKQTAGRIWFRRVGDCPSDTNTRRTTRKITDAI